MTLTFNPRQALIWTHTMRKINVNSHGSKARVETNGRTDGHDRSHYLSRYMLSVNIRALPLPLYAVGKYSRCFVCTIESTATSCRSTKAKGRIAAATYRIILAHARYFLYLGIAERCPKLPLPLRASNNGFLGSPESMPK